LVDWSIGWRDSRHEEVGGNEAPGEPRPPGLPSLIEGYTLKILNVTIPSCAFAFEEIAQAVSERGHRRALRLTRTADVSCPSAARQPETLRPAKASFHRLPLDFLWLLLFNRHWDVPPSATRNPSV
jgi:hypothetical protein